MFRIYDGREQFYQWDSNRRIVIDDDSINELHYCNKTSNESLVTPVYEENGKRLSDVPNILLQTDWPITVYGFDRYYTKHCARYDVVKRTKPADYVYTETEKITIANIEQMIAEMEANFEAYAKGYIEENKQEFKGEKGDKGDKGDTPSLEGYATEQYVSSAISDAIKNLELPEGEGGADVDLSNYYTKQETDEFVDTVLSMIPRVELGEVITDGVVSCKYNSGEMYVGVIEKGSYNSKFLGMAGQEVLVELDGAKYVMTVKQKIHDRPETVLEEKTVYVGNASFMSNENEDTGEPFLFCAPVTMDSDYCILCCGDTVPTDHNFKMSVANTIKLDAAYLPDEAATKEYVEQFLGAGAFIVFGVVENTSGTLTASANATNAEIYEAFAAGRDIRCLVDYHGLVIEGAPVTIDESSAAFYVLMGENCYIFTINNDECHCELLTFAKTTDISGFTTEEDVNSLIDAKLAEIGVAEEGAY